MFKNIRYNHIIIILLLAFLLCMSGCRSVHNVTVNTEHIAFREPQYSWTTDQHEPIVIWTREHDLDRIYMQRAFERYEKLTGNKINIVTFQQDKFESVVIDALVDGRNMPDLILSYGGTNIDRFDPDKNFYDFSSAPWVKDLTATSINKTIYHGKIIGLPHWESSISGIVYNKELFKKFNIPVPSTQAEFMNACKILKANGVIPMYLPYQVSSMMLYQFPMDSILSDQDLLNKLNKGEISYSDIPEMATIVQWYRNMSDLGYFGDDYLKNDWKGMSDALSSRRYAMMLCWDTWLYTDFKGNPAEFGIMPAFMGTPQNGVFEGPNQALLIVNRRSVNLNAALNLITFLADPYNYNAAFSGIYTAPIFKNQTTSISTPQYVAAEKSIENNFVESVTWMRLKGFAQTDAVVIQKYMTAQPGYSLEQCLRDLDSLRKERIASTEGREK